MKKGSERQNFRRTETVTVNKGKSLVWLTVLCAMMLAAGLLLAVRLFVNHSFLKNYEQGEFVTEGEEKLLWGNLPERYLPYYNLGNAAYKRGDYKEAVMRYEQALARHPGIYDREKECRVRINLALSMVKQLDLKHLDSEEKVEYAVNVLLSARDVLTENGCANPEAGVYDGHSKDAEQLKKEIDELLKQLQDPEQQQSGGGSDDEEEEGSKDQNTETNREKELRKKLEEQMSESAQEKADAQQQQDQQQDQGQDGGSGQNNGANW